MARIATRGVCLIEAALGAREDEGATLWRGSVEAAGGSGRHDGIEKIVSDYLVLCIFER
jgi:hypothetical protein